MYRRLATAFLLLFVASAVSACMVPATRYDEARSALKVEQEANRRGAAKLYEVEQKVASLQAQLDKRQRKLDQQGQQIAAAQLDKNVANKQRDNASQLVDQLRGELARVGDNLRSFAEQKQKLSDALDAAQAREKRLEEVEHEAAQRAMVVRDLALLLDRPISTGAVELTMVDGRPVLRIASAKALAGKTILPEGRKLLSAVARVAGLHADTSVTVRELHADAALSEEQETLRLRALSDALAAQGLASQRVTLDVEQPAQADSDAGSSSGDAEPQADDTAQQADDAQPAGNAQQASAGTPTLEIEIATGQGS